MTYEELADAALERWAEAGDPEAVTELRRRHPDRGAILVVFADQEDRDDQDGD